MGRKFIYLLIGILLFIILLLIPSPHNMSLMTWRMVSITVFVVFLWVTEALPLPITSLMPIFLIPLFGILPPSKATVSYGAPMIYLLLGGFLFAAALEKWNLHKRFSYTILKVFGNTHSGIIMAFMIICGFISMWISNGAVALMIAPIGMAFIATLNNDDAVCPQSEIKENSIDKHSLNSKIKENSNNEKLKLSKSILYTIAVGSTIGGMATVIGTPPNALMVGMMSSLYKIDITFLEWMKVGVPLVIILLFISWFVICKIFFRTSNLELPKAKEICIEELSKMGPVGKAEKRVYILFSFTALFWILAGIFKGNINHNISDTTIAVFGAIFLFIIPSGINKDEKLLDWKTAKNLPWGVLLLVGGGIALANGFEASGLNHYVKSELINAHIDKPIIVISLFALFSIMLTQFAPNIAVATLFIPIMGTAASIMTISEISAIMPVVLGASLSFTLPVGTPPNAIIYGEGIIKQKDMIKPGTVIALFGWVFIIVITQLIY
ncbi:MAG: SLC13 family permease [Bacteroidales bacterium]|nr:SLC13 family permease [Bacteroidales bacterium]